MAKLNKDFDTGPKSGGLNWFSLTEMAAVLKYADYAAQVDRECGLEARARHRKALEAYNTAHKFDDDE